MAKVYDKKEARDANHEVDEQSFGNEALGQLQSSTSYSSEDEKRLVRKIDFRVLPIMLIAYMMAFLDKQALSYTSLMGIIDDLHLVGSEYSWAGSMFYFGYLFFSYPASLLMVKFPLGKYLAVNFILWSIILACHAATTNFSTLMAVRFFLGCTEASLSPGFSLLTSLWYRTSEQPLRHGVWFCGNSISLIFGNLIAVGIWQIHGSLAPWKWLFIIFGVVTFFFGLVMLFFLPNSPTDAKFLTEKERLIATERLKANKTGYKNTHVERAQIKEAFKDVKTWLLAILILGLDIPNGGYTTFNGLVLEGFGFSIFHTLLLGIPGGFIVFLFVLAGGILTSKVRQIRCIVIVIMTIISIIGTVLVFVTTSKGSRYVGLILMGVYSASMPISMSMISSNVGGFTKRATVSAIYFIMYCAGNIIGPQLFFSWQAPKYQSGFLAILVCLAVCVVDGLALLWYLRWENRRRDRMEIETESPGEKHADIEPNSGLADITDFENLRFRYVY